jgi:hypothetical protein
VASPDRSPDGLDDHHLAPLELAVARHQALHSVVSALARVTSLAAASTAARFTPDDSRLVD